MIEDEGEYDVGDDDPGAALNVEDDVATTPAANADDATEVAQYIRPEVLDLYEVYSYRHAAAILGTSFRAEFDELQDALMAFRLTRREIGLPGGNESIIPKKIARSLRPLGWAEARVQGDLLVRMQKYDEEFEGNKVRKLKRPEVETRTLQNFIDGHKIDFVKGQVAFDLEWNSKDQTFDRDLYAFRAFHDCGLIAAGVMLTRGASMSTIFPSIPLLDKAGNPVLEKTGRKNGQVKDVRAKYGASTTWMGKLLYRLNAGRHGGCPVLAFGITPAVLDEEGRGNVEA